MSVHKTSVSVHRHRLPSQLIDDDVCGNSARTLLPLEILKFFVWLEAKKVPKKIEMFVINSDNSSEIIIGRALYRNYLF